MCSFLGSGSACLATIVTGSSGPVEGGGISTISSFGAIVSGAPMFSSKLTANSSTGSFASTSGANGSERLNSTPAAGTAAAEVAA